MNPEYTEPEKYAVVSQADVGKRCYSTDYGDWIQCKLNETEEQLNTSTEQRDKALELIDDALELVRNYDTDGYHSREEWKKSWLERAKALGKW